MLAKFQVGPIAGEDTGSAEASGAVGELIASFKRKRAYEEVALALRSAIRDASAEFSFLRVKGLRCLLKALRSFANDAAAVSLFRRSQSLPELRVTSPATEIEVALALRVLEGCCLLHRESKLLAKQLDATQVLLNISSTRGALEQGACLDAFIALMVDSHVNQMDFESLRGIEKIADLMKDDRTDENIRLKCCEFLLLLMGHIYGRERPPLATMREDLQRLLGEKCASIIWAASQFGSTLDPEQRQTALHIQARRVLESLDLYCSAF